MMRGIFFLVLFLFSGCSYHYSSQGEQKPVATSIQSLHVASFEGVNIKPSYQVWFESALRQSLQKRSFIDLAQASGNGLHVKVVISPVLIKRYRDVDIFKNKVFVVDKSVHLEAEYELTDSSGKKLLQSSYGSTNSSTSDTTTSYADADEIKPLHVIHKELMQSMAEAIAQRVVNATSHEN